jgi:hypothetical protein
MSDEPLFSLSPKVVRPFLVGLVAFAVVAITAGFDTEALVLLVANFAYAILGVAAPPVARSKVTQAALARKHR